MVHIARKLSDVIGRAGLAVAGILLIGIVCLILLEVVLRSFFNMTTFIRDEFVAYGVAGTTFFALAHAFGTGGILRIRVLVDQLSPGKVHLLDLLTIVAGLMVSGFLTYFSWLRVARSWVRQSTSGSVVPVQLWIPEGVVFVGLCLVLVQMISLLVQNLSGSALPDGVAAAAREE